MKKPAPEEKAIQDIAAVFAEISDHQEMRLFFDEIFTPAERRDLALRWKLLRRLHEGVAQRKIADELGISLCKITRGSRILKNPGAVSSRMCKNQEIRQ